MPPAEVARPPIAARAFAWTGGALFVAALLFFAYSYGVRFGRVPAAPPPGGTAGAIGLDLLLFAAFTVHHSAMARTGVKRWLATRFPPAHERSLYVWIASLLFLIVCAAWQPLPGLVYEAEGPIAWLLRLAQLAGIAVTIGGVRRLDPLELAGIRQVYGEVTAPAFTVAGPYRWVRHPVYLGWLLMVFGAPAMTATRLTFAIVSSAYLVVAIPWEERSLIGEFGERYRAYQREVRWRMIPGVY